MLLPASSSVMVHLHPWNIFLIIIWTNQPGVWWTSNLRVWSTSDLFFIFFMRSKKLKLELEWNWKDLPLQSDPGEDPRALQRDYITPAVRGLERGMSGVPSWTRCLPNPTTGTGTLGINRAPNTSPRPRLEKNPASTFLCANEKHLEPRRKLQEEQRK